MDGISDAPVSANEIPDGFSADSAGNAKAAEQVSGHSASF
jgi:hypothetical protein